MRLEKQQANALIELGIQAMRAEVADPAYAQVLDKVAAIEEQIESTEEKLAEYQAEFSRQQGAKNDVKSYFNSLIVEACHDRQQTKIRLRRAIREHTGAERQIEQVNRMQERARVALEASLKQLSRLTEADEGGNAERVAVLENRVSTLSQNVANLDAQASQLVTDLRRSESEQQKVEAEVEGAQKHLAALQQELQRTLTPVTRQIEAVVESTKAIKASHASLGEQLRPLLAKLGKEVNRVRPDSSALAAGYRQLDEVQLQINRLRQETSLLQKRLQMLSPTTVRNAYLILGGGAVLLLGVTILLGLGLLVLASDSTPTSFSATPAAPNIIVVPGSSRPSLMPTDPSISSPSNNANCLSDCESRHLSCNRICRLSSTSIVEGQERRCRDQCEHEKYMCIARCH